MAQVEHNVFTLKELMDERDIRYQERFEAQERATDIYQRHADEWRANANEWRQAMIDRERNFFPKAMGYLGAAITGSVSVIALVVAIVERMK